MKTVEQAATQVRLDQYRALVDEISTDPVAHARLGDRLIEEYLEREAAEIGAEIEQLKG